MPDTHNIDGPERNRAPCVNCKSSKRRCDRSKPRCSRCTQRNVSCIPSSTAQWRVNGVFQQSRRANSTSGASNQIISSTISASSPPVSVEPTGQEECQSLLRGSTEASNGYEPHTLHQVSEPDPLPGTNEPTLLETSMDFEYDPTLLEKLWALPLQPALPDEAQAYPFEISTDMPIQIDNEMMNPRMPLLPCPVSYLWEEFIGSVVPGIALDGREPDDQVTKYITSKALGKPALFSAIVFFSYSVRINWLPESPSLVQFNEMSEAALRMEHTALTHLDDSGPHTLDTQISSDQRKTTVLSTLVALSSAYIARGDTENLTLCLHRAMMTAHDGFNSQLATDATFLFLVRWIGYIHVAAMLGRTTYTINAPNYLSIAANLGDANTNPNMFFQDVDSFLAISQAVGEILYRIGRVLNSNKQSSSSCHITHLKTDIMDVETRLQLIFRQINTFKEQNGDLENHFDLYNEALCHSGFLLILLDVKKESYMSSRSQSIVSQILDSCAAVPEKSPVAKLMLLPLFYAGVCTSRPVHQAFIRRRLEVLRSGCCIANVNRTIEILEGHWSRFKNSGTIPDLPESSVCIFF